MKFNPFTLTSHGALLVLALTASVHAQSDSNHGMITDPDYGLQIERARNIVAPITRRGSAVSAAVGVDGKLVWSQAFGYSSLDKTRQASTDDAFHLYSLIKPITALLALRTVLQGEIAFETTAREVFPELPDTYEQINLRHLLTHTSGIRHYFHPQEAVEFGHCEQASRALHRFVNDPLVHRPGEQETYSTYGFVLASAMLEARTGTPFSDLLSRHLTPTAGVSLELDSRNRPDSGLHFYDVQDDGEVTAALPFDNSCKMGGGGFRGSAQDLVAIYNAASNGDLAPMPAISQLLGGRTLLTAGGSGIGGEAVSVIDFDSRISVVLLSNTSGLEQRIALRRARDLLLSVFDDEL